VLNVLYVSIRFVSSPKSAVSATQVIYLEIKTDLVIENHA